jgi:urease accessory protein
MNWDKATSTESGMSDEGIPSTEQESMSWLVGLLQLGDTFYPTGSYAHSFGLEGLVEQGVVCDRETLREFLVHSALPALRQSELPLVIHAWTALGGGGESAADWDKVGELSRLASALKSAKEARFAAENIGRQRVELTAKLRQHDLAVEFVKRAEAERWPYSPALASALEARVLGAPLEAALASVYYASIAGVLTAAMKLLRIGQNGCQTLLTEMLQRAPEIVAAARQVPVEEIGWFNPWLDIAAARHERAAARLFIS